VYQNSVTSSPRSTEPISASGEWQRPFDEQLWSFVRELLFGAHSPLDLAKLRDIDWAERFPARDVEWEGLPMRAVKLPAPEPAWLIVRPELWGQIGDFVAWARGRRVPMGGVARPAPIVLAPEIQSQAEVLLARSLDGMADGELRSVVLMHMSGRLIAWRGRDAYEDVLRMGLAGVKAQLLGLYLDSLIEHGDGPMNVRIDIPFERDTAFDPAAAAGAHIRSTNEMSFGGQWMLVAGVGESGHDDAVESRIRRLGQDLEALLPALE